MESGCSAVFIASGDADIERIARISAANVFRIVVAIFVKPEENIAFPEF